MKSKIRWRGFAALLLAISCAGGAFAQRAGVYDINKDVSLQGTVLKYTENSRTAPIGTHVLLQTSAGNVDVHLGDSRLLHANKLSIVTGANIRFVGQMSTAGQNPIFLARLVQVGTQVVAVRSERGLPLAATGSASKNAQAVQKGGPR